MKYWSYTVYKKNTHKQSYNHDCNPLQYDLIITSTLWPGQRNHRRSQTRSAPWWRQSSCRRSSRGNGTYAGMTSGRGPAGGAVESGTGKRSSHWLAQPGCPPDLRYQLQYEHLEACRWNEKTNSRDFSPPVFYTDSAGKKDLTPSWCLSFYTYLSHLHVSDDQRNFTFTRQL